MNEITPVSAPVGQVTLPDIRDLKEDTREIQPHRERLRYMADLLEALPEDGRFNLSSWDSCICAWTHHASGQSHRPLAKLNPIHVAREWLGIPLREAEQLFSPDLGMYGDVTAKQAARVLRHYVDTGNVDWQVAALEGIPRLAHN